LDGLIGLDFFRNHIVQIDFEARRIRLLDRADSTGPPLPMETRPSGLVVMASVDRHKPQWLRVDTGCASPLQWVTRRTVHSTGHNAEPAIGLAVLTIPEAQVAVRLGNYSFQNVPAGLHRDAIFPGESGLLGAGLLAHFKTVTLDAPAGRLFFGDLNSEAPGDLNSRENSIQVRGQIGMARGGAQPRVPTPPEADSGSGLAIIYR
jgi:hypothetical protein